MKTFPLLLLFLLLCVRLEGCAPEINMHIHGRLCRTAISSHCFRQAVKKKGGGRSVEREKGSGEETMGLVVTQKNPFQDVAAAAAKWEQRKMKNCALEEQQREKVAHF